MSLEDSADRHLDQALLHYKEEDFDQALEACELAIEIEPYLADAHNLRGLVLEELDQPLRALSAYKEALFLDPDHVEAEENLSALRAALAEQSGFVTIAAFSHPMQAQIVRGRLEAEGVPSFVADESTVTAFWLISNMVGGVKLRVKGEDVEKALDILAQEPEPIEWDEEDVTDEEAEVDDYDGPEECPHCGSINIRYEKYNIRLAFLSWLLLSVLLPFLKKEWHCQDCGHIWKE
ncbi:MAG: DUF2007 domain-containing protein [Anaerolineae bacterium]|nr:DUF2007 domain-containing protein [Anaerolineae bacterium]